MARQGFFSRIGSFLKGLFEPAETSPPQPPSPPEEPPESGGEGGSFYERAEALWDDSTGLTDRKGHREFNEHLDVFYSIPTALEGDPEERLDLWRFYIETWVLDEMRRAEFWEEFGIDPSDFDWEGWREARGYSRKQ